jgi:hypothetical protein
MKINNIMLTTLNFKDVSEENFEELLQKHFKIETLEDEVINISNVRFNSLSLIDSQNNNSIKDNWSYKGPVY